MSGLVLTLAVLLLAWLGLCAVCGARRRGWLFLGVLCTGLTLNQLWMMLGLQARALEEHVLVAQASAAAHGLAAFVAGWLARRLGQALSARRLAKPEA